MSQVFNLKRGDITFHEDEIVINDQDAKQMKRILFSSSLWTFYGVVSVLRHLKEPDPFLLWSGLIIGISHFCILLWTLFKVSTRSRIKIADIKSVGIKHPFGGKNLVIKLKNNRVRTIRQVEDPDGRLADFIQRTF